MNAKSKRNVRTQPGFSMIELTLVLVVMSLVLGAVMVGYKSLTSDAKTNTLVDFTEKIVTATEAAKLKCYNTFRSILASTNNANGFNSAFTNNACGIWESGVRTSGTNFLVSGTEVSASYNPANGKVTLVFRAVQDFRDKLRAAIENKYGNTYMNGNTPTARCTNSGVDLACVVP